MRWKRKLIKQSIEINMWGYKVSWIWWGERQKVRLD